ncbi:uncharacterized protein LY89DRAFT_785633 [Mollisia scopiformis]|uniref:ER-bound oxygenase mpaB/mpaB'/Rubber oxygenase catalytic domain-containing protein n=1 Tax=Mollisia scopiformis TaxID=149040 RepID=A0A194WW89_MOLSC|nr:uncharacterized protein LY89DRAFT_785633 [Mollisia scopiformis]KUJ12235.1 hypothetical protein LY89DRAFT_785633 [Mollisia scopiformis]
MLPLGAALLWLLATLVFVSLPGFFLYSPASGSVKLISFVGVSALAVYYHYAESADILLADLKAQQSAHPWYSLCSIMLFCYLFRKVQQKLRYVRVYALMEKHGFTANASTFNNMSIEVAQEVEANMAEYEFPRLYQFAWISDFLRTSTDPGVSRALIRSGHMVNPDPMIEHERLQATIHLMGAFMAYPLKSPMHSMVMARINEHHHRYGIWINSDDILYLIIHFAMIPGQWINQFGYRKLYPFEQQALWVLWREIGCMMGCRYVPESLAAAKTWRKAFEKHCRWPCDENEQAGMAMLNEIIYSCPSFLKPVLRAIVVSILDWDIAFYCQMLKLGRNLLIGFTMFRIFDILGWLIRHFGFPRLTPYKRTFEHSRKDHRIVHVRHTPYDTLPFYQPRTFWNMYGFGAIIRRLLGFPAPSFEFYSEGTTVEAMGAAQLTPASQFAVEQKVRQKAVELQRSPPGYRPAIGYQAGRLLPAIEDVDEYGSELNRYPPGTPILPGSDKRFDKKYEVRCPGYSKIDVMESPEDILAFDIDEAYPKKLDKVGSVVLAVV